MINSTIKFFPVDYAGAIPGSLIFAVVLAIVAFIVIITFTVYYLYKIISSQRGRHYTGSESMINKMWCRCLPRRTFRPLFLW